MSTKMLHRGPMDRLTTFTHLPILSTFVLLLIQFQIFHAHPTSVASSSTFSDGAQNTQEAAAASQASSVYSPAYSYSSYRPGLEINSYRPYAYQSIEPQPQPAAIPQFQPQPHPNSVYSSQSALPESKLTQFIEKDDDDAVSKKNIVYIPQQIGSNEKKVTTTFEKKTQTQEKSRAPRLNPLPLPSSSSENVKVGEPENEQKKLSSPSEEEQRRSVELSFPPPFAPEFDPQYERREAGLGPISLLDQAGPFW